MESKPYICILCGEITWDTANLFIREIYQGFLHKEFNKVLLSISTPGGDADAAWSIHTALKHLGCEIITLANGRVFSAGIIVYLTGGERYCFDESLFLFHPPTVISIMDEERPTYQMEEAITGQRIDEKLFRKILENILPKATKKDIIRLTHRHKSEFVSAKDALRLGIATHIINNIAEINL